MRYAVAFGITLEELTAAANKLADAGLQPVGSIWGGPKGFYQPFFGKKDEAPKAK